MSWFSFQTEFIWKSHWRVEGSQAQRMKNDFTVKTSSYITLILAWFAWHCMTPHLYSLQLGCIRCKSMGKWWFPLHRTGSFLWARSCNHEDCYCRAKWWSCIFRSCWRSCVLEMCWWILSRIVFCPWPWFCQAWVCHGRDPRTFPAWGWLWVSWRTSTCCIVQVASSQLQSLLIFSNTRFFWAAGSFFCTCSYQYRGTQSISGQHIVIMP